MADKANPAAAQVAGDPRPGSSSSSQPTANDGSQAQGNSPSGSSSSNQIPCQWAGCSEYHPTPEALYDHVCEKHVGRKSTNNLNLTCAWGNCHTTTVKRDHITSHIRVHVPLKPHKCDLCGKSFKRPQDLKKHVKTHAEDPNQGMRGQDGPSSRPHQNGYHGMPGPPRMDGYGYGGGMQTGHAVNYPYPTHGGGMHYVPTSHGGGAPGGHYGQVYYPAAAPIGGHTFADGRDGGFAATQRLFDDMRRESFNPKDYGAVSNLLMGMQQYQLPIPMVGAGGGDYGVATSASGGFYGTASMHAQDAPSFSNLRTKQDLLEINDILQKMTATAYEHPSHLSFQPAVPTGAMDIAVGHRNQRLSQSPPSSALPNPHATDAASEHGTTPALTPGSSAMSYTSERSPPATHSNTVSPTVPSYPSLPSVANGSNMGPVDTLGTRYNSDVHRRYSGSNLQQRAPAARRGSADMDIDTPAADRKGKSKRDPTIDPALGGATSSSSSSGSSSAASVASDDTATPGREEEAAHGFNLRLLENLKSFITGMLERGEFEDENGSRHSEDDDDDDDDERVRRALTQDQDADMEDAEDKAVPKPEVAYPELKI